MSHLARLTGAAFAVALVLNGGAFAQSLNLGVGEKGKTQEQLDREAAQEKAWRAATEKVPDAKPADPWGNLRTTPTASTAPKAKNR